MFSLRVSVEKYCKTAAAVISLSFFASSFASFTFLEKDVRAAWSKTQENTYLGVSEIQNPSTPVDKNSKWVGDFVFFGKYDNDPIKFRVLDPHSTKFGDDTLFLDSDSALYKAYFDNTEPYSNVWADSDIRRGLNGEKFLEKNNGFTDIEKDSIANSVISSHEYTTLGGEVNVPSYVKEFGSYVALTGEKIFMLDMEDVVNPSYGYSEKATDSKTRHKAYGTGVVWWLRSAYVENDVIAGRVMNAGNLNGFGVYTAEFCVSPALNVDLSSIMFSSLISGTMGNSGAEYKLTLLDSNMVVEMPKESSVRDIGESIQIPFTVSGKDAAKANQISILVTDECYDRNASILYYDAVKVYGSLTEGLASFSLPSNIKGKWGTDYHVYILAEELNDMYESDYSSKPFELSAPETAYSVELRKIKNGQVNLSAEYACQGERVVVSAVPDSGYVIDKITYTPEGKKSVDATVTQSFVMPEGKVQVDVSFKKLDYSITLKNGPNGDASVSASSASEGTVVTVSVRPNSGYEVDKITLLYDGGKTYDITLSKSFSMPAMNITINVLYKKSKTTTIPTPTTTPSSYPTEVVVPTFEPTIIPTTSESGTSANSKKQIKDFVGRLYEYVLNRAPENGGIDYWTDQLYSFRQSGAEVAQGFIFSEEFINRNTSNEEYVTILYKTFFGREPEKAGFDYWVGSLKDGSNDRVAVANGFIYSLEWANTCAEYGIRSGGNTKPTVNIAPSDLTYSFVERMYTTAMKRQSDSEGKAYWAKELANFNITGEMVGVIFFLSEEMVSFNLSNREFVTRLYKTFMDRDPEQGGFDYWVKYLNDGNSRADAVYGFTRSAEFVDKCIEARILPY